MPTPEKKHLSLFVTLGAVLIPLTLAVGGFAYYFWTQQKKAVAQAQSQLFEKAYEHYIKGEFAPAAEMILGQESMILTLPEGCELLISLYAQMTDQAERLRDTSQTCMTQNRAMGLSHEGFAKGSLELGKGKEALEVLRAEADKHPDERVYGALANLAVMTGDAVLGTEYFCKAMGISQVWSAWLSRVLKIPEITKNPELLTQVTQVVLTKEQIVAPIEDKLLASLMSLELKDLEATMGKRLAK